ncbi:MAG: prepilin-type N-terminal cleavage/methylation domain-containing protein [Zoogloeaceae bacterium]|jgi:prepilin-type N-terminal cleavage/methylation domain-containing protein|nr:prepilin-type N-terminal cleavage/methylation domain-containing protein [Zoogloeaceae bacterium]
MNQCLPLRGRWREAPHDGCLLSSVLCPLNSGFTLIELLLVVAILSAAALAAFSFAADDRSQVRMEDTHNRLLALRRAVLGVEAPAYGGEMRLSGFVADNGMLPETVAELVKPDSFLEKAGIPAAYSSTLDDDCVQNSPASLGGTAILLKGHRGNYLNGLTRNNTFRDGWGNVAASTTTPPGDDNFGWLVNNASTDHLSITSLGADNVSDTPGVENDLDAEDDQTMQIEPADWLIPLAGWQVTVKNRSATNLDLSTGNVSAALLVFRNIGTNGQWLRFNSADNNGCAITLAQGEQCALTFNQITCGSSTEARSIPSGRHLLVLLKDTDLYKNSDNTPVTAQPLFYPHADRPAITLEIR